MTTTEFDWSECPAVWRDPERMSGKWCFNKTRLPISYLFNCLASGSTMEEFVEWYPPMDIKKCKAVLEFAAKHSDKILRRDTALA